jgi:2-hydroxy-6-oxonona-2,4-dienedioate hydrolase
MSIWTELSPIAFRVEYVDAAGVTTRTLRAGNPDAEPVVFLHGTSGHLEAFTRNVVAHAEYDVHAIDMLGHGYTGKPGYPYEIPRYVEHLLAYLDAEGIDSAHIVGESLGEWVGAWAANRCAVGTTLWQRLTGTRSGLRRLPDGQRAPVAAIGD